MWTRSLSVVRLSLMNRKKKKNKDSLYPPASWVRHLPPPLLFPFIRCVFQSSLKPLWVFFRFSGLFSLIFFFVTVPFLMKKRKEGRIPVKEKSTDWQATHRLVRLGPFEWRATCPLKERCRRTSRTWIPCRNYSNDKPTQCFFIKCVFFLYSTV